MTTTHTEGACIHQKMLLIKELILKVKMWGVLFEKTKGREVSHRRLFYPRIALSLAFLEF
jgi:hypothetical protein